ncbi:MAG: hypothetical protein JRC91_11900 [Deltaproteobacteria bacterium]|nr:hypothetical protein [Deltaproteobacteria bacterium]
MKKKYGQKKSAAAPIVTLNQSKIDYHNKNKLLLTFFIDKANRPPYTPLKVSQTKLYSKAVNQMTESK